MIKKYFIGLDLGTSSVKAVLFDGEKVIKKTASPFSIKDCTLTDGVTYKGFDIDSYAETVFKVISTLASKVDGNVYGISMASASGNTVVCDKNGKPMLDAYSWTNGVIEKESQMVYGSLTSSYVQNVCGWPYFSTFPLSHLAQIKVHKPEVIDNLGMVCMSTEYLLYKMTNKWGIDKSTAVPFYLLEQQAGNWHEPYLKALGITKDKLPKVYNSGDLLGEITEEFASKYKINKDCKVFLGSFDHPSGAIANGVVNEGELLLSCGTSWVLFFPYKDRQKLIKNNLLCDTFLSSEKGLWGAMCSIAQVSLKIDKIIDKTFDGKDKLMLFNEYSQKASRGAGGLSINPVLDSDKDFSSYSKENVARALMEGAANMLKEKFENLKQLGITFNLAKMAGGPSKSSVWVDVIRYTLNIPVEVIYGVDSGAVGAAKRIILKEKVNEKT